MKEFVTTVVLVMLAALLSWAIYIIPAPGSSRGGETNSTQSTQERNPEQQTGPRALQEFITLKPGEISVFKEIPRKWRFGFVLVRPGSCVTVVKNQEDSGIVYCKGTPVDLGQNNVLGLQFLAEGREETIRLTRCPPEDPKPCQ